MQCPGELAYWLVMHSAQQLPSPSLAYLKALLPRPLLFMANTVAGGSVLGAQIDTAEPRLRVNLDAQSLQMYRLAVHSSASVPALYPQILASGLVGELFLHPRFPVKTRTLVHVANEAEIYRSLEPHTRLELTVHLEQLGKAKKGAQASVLTEVFEHGRSDRILARYRTVVLMPVKHTLDNASDAFVVKEWPDSISEVTKSVDIGIDASTAWHYARISKDYNPIHLSRWAAKLFGYRSSIMHGLWMAARGLSTIESWLTPPYAFRTQFVRPVFLPTQCQLDFHEHGFRWRQKGGHKDLVRAEIKTLST